MAVFEEMVLKLLLYIAPMYFANSSAMVLGGKTPIDFGKNFIDGKRLLGNGKTFKGTFLGIAIGTITGVIIYYFFPAATMTLSNEYVFLAFLLSTGAIVGDIVASFFKRRNDIKSGQEVLLLDQLDFVIGGMIFSSLLYVPGFYEILFVSIITLIVHKISNYVAFKIKLKKVPW